MLTFKELYRQTFKLIQQTWGWLVAPTILSAFPVEEGWAMAPYILVLAVLWIFATFALGLKLIKPVGQQEVNKNMHLFWPYVWRNIVMSLILALPTVVVGILLVLIAFLAFPNASDLATSFIPLAIFIMGLGLSLVLYGLIATWLIAVLDETEPSLKAAFSRGRVTFWLTIGLLFKGPILFSVGITIVLVACTVAAALAGIDIIIVETASNVIGALLGTFGIAMTAPVIVNVYRTQVPAQG